MVINALLCQLIHSHIGVVVVWCVGSLQCVVVTQVDVVIVTKFKVSAMARPAWPYSDKMAAAEIQHREHQPAQHSTTTSHHLLCSDLCLGLVLGLCVWGQ